MFDIGFWELCLVGVVALIVLGPEKLPSAARTAGLWVRRAKRMASEIRADIESEFELEDLNRMSAGYRRSKRSTEAGKAGPGAAPVPSAASGRNEDEEPVSKPEAGGVRGDDGATKADPR